MPARTLPTQFTPTRSFQLGHLAVVSGTPVTAQAAAQAVGGKLAEFVNRGWLVPDRPLYPVTGRRAQGNVRTTPTWSISAKELAQLIAG